MTVFGLVVDSDDSGALATAEVGGGGGGLLVGEVGGGGGGLSVGEVGGGVDWKKVISGKDVLLVKELSLKFCGDLQFLLFDPLNVLLEWNLNFS